MVLEVQWDDPHGGELIETFEVRRRAAVAAPQTAAALCPPRIHPTPQLRMRIRGAGCGARGADLRCAADEEGPRPVTVVEVAGCAQREILLTHAPPREGTTDGSLRNVTVCLWGTGGQNRSTGTHVEHPSQPRRHDGPAGPAIHLLLHLRPRVRLGCLRCRDPRLVGLSQTKQE